MALGSSSRNGKKAIWIAIHTAEGSRTKESLYNYFDSSQAASSHAGIDAAGIANWLPDSVGAWTMLGGNPYAIQAELCAFARWTRAQWLSDQTQDGCANPRQMIRNTAKWVNDVSKRNNIQIRRLTDAQIRGRSETGLLGHGDYSRATGDGDHTDPGPNFPWDVLFADIAALNGQTAPIEGDDEMSWDTQITRTPSTKDPRKTAPASEMLRYANEAAWKAADAVPDILAAITRLEAASAANAEAILTAVEAIPTTTGPDGAPVARLEDVTEAVKNVFRQVRMGFPVTNPGTGG